MSYWLDTVAEAPYTDQGAWRSTRPAPPMRKVFGYVNLPICSFTVDSGWLGASYIRAEYSYTASRKFGLQRPIVPVSTFCLCIRCERDGVIYRYKLWEDVGERLFVPLYDGELIERSFVLELWTVQSSNTIVNPAVKRIILGTRHNPTECPIP